MGKTKKPFIDKKNSSTYHLLHRSQRDVGGDGSGTILWPSDENKQETNEKVLGSSGQNTLNEWKDQMAEVGLVDDYDYEKHMKPITGSGDFFGTDGHKGDALNDVRAVPTEDDIHEVSRQLDSIALTPDCMDEEIAQALFGDFDETDFEEILDDFCMTAAQAPEGEEEAAEFDFDAHVQQLLEKARLKNEGTVIDAEAHNWGRQDQDFFSKGKPLRQLREDEDDDYDDYDDDGEDVDAPGIVTALSPDEERALCEKFEQTMAEYDSDDVGDLDEECDYIGGERPLEGDKRVEAALDEYLEEREADFFIDGTSHLPEYQRVGGSGFKTIERDVHEPEKMDEVLAEADDFLRTSEMMLPPEEILIDGKSYFSLSSRNPWDCESVLSTYSNLDNNPATIERGGRRHGKNKKKTPIEPLAEEEEEHVHIRLSNKTGLPLGVLGGREKGDDFDFDTIASVNKGEKRNTDETTVQKKIRKQQVKQERQICRIQKKMMKEAFKDEFLKADGVSDDIAGKSVFRF